MTKTTDMVDEPVELGAGGDRDLMAFFDGELSRDDLTDDELEEELLAQEHAEDKLFGLGFVGELVREHVDADERADGIADAVMAALEADVVEDDEEAADVAKVIELVPKKKAEPLEAEDESEETAEPKKTIELKKAPVGGAANDNSRNVWTLAAAAAAVAAGLFIWGNGASEDVSPVASRATTTVEAPSETVAPAPETIDPSLPGEVAMGDPQRGGADDEDAVEIAQLDFGEGEHTGSIFKVDNDSTGVHTAVVWVTDLGDDE